MSASVSRVKRLTKREVIAVLMRSVSLSAMIFKLLYEHPASVAVADLRGRGARSLKYSRFRMPFSANCLSATIWVVEERTGDRDHRPVQ